MIRATFAALADNVLIDPQTNQISVINMFDEVRPASLPVSLPRLAFVVLLEKDPSDPDEFEGRIKGSIGDEVLFEAGLPVKFQGLQKTRSVTRFHSPVIQKEGKLEILVVNADGEPLGFGRASLMVVLAQPPASMETPSPAPEQKN